MTQFQRRATSLIALVSAVCLAAVWACSAITIASGTLQVDANAGSSVASSDIGSTWRFTKHGWQDSKGWPAADSFAPIKTIELLHPFVWAGIVLVAVIATMIWASSEWEIARLFDRDIHNRLDSSSGSENDYVI